MSTPFSPITAELRQKLEKIRDIKAAAEMLYWDMATYMPPGGSQARARQIATLESIYHNLAVDPELGHSLDAAEQSFANAHGGALPQDRPDDNDAALLRVARRHYIHMRRVPPAFAGEAADHFSRTYSIWTDARAANDFSLVQPYLEKTLTLSQRYAEFFPDAAHPADPFIDDGDHGLTVALIRPLFSELRARLAPLVREIATRPKPRHDFLQRHYPKAQQLALGETIARRLGYDFQRGRQDQTHHPFMIKFAHGDIRITTRVNENDLSENLFSVMHEVGHALYEQGIEPGFDGTPLYDGTSNGVHESQSRLWENLVGRSREFWENSFGALRAVFPDQLHDVDAEAFYRAVNLVKPSLIRTDADEVTYNLHVIIRFELECQMLEGSLAIADLPDAWHAAYEESLGLHSPTDANGVLQDVHWHSGYIGGAFQGYALGNIISCQIFEAAQKELPDLAANIQQGEFTPLLGWLQNNVYRHGSKYTTQELLTRITGEGIALDPYFRYLNRKFGELYQLGTSE